MHLLFLLGAVALALGLSAVAPTFADHFRRPRGRAMAQLVLLALPPLVVAVAGLTLLAMTRMECFGHCGLWDQAASLLMAGVALGWLATRLVRFAERSQRLDAMVSVLRPTRDPRVRRIVRFLTPRAVPVRVLAGEHPLAFVHGWRDPSIVLSSWLLENMDDAELEAVLAHEIAHVIRGDAPIVWWATLFRQCWPLAPQQAVWERLLSEGEEATDRMAVRRTGRPLALASALHKILAFPTESQYPLSALSATPSFHDGGTALVERRIERLIAERRRKPRSFRHDLGRMRRLLGGAAAITAVLVGMVPTAMMWISHQVVCGVPAGQSTHHMP